MTFEPSSQDVQFCTDSHSPIFYWWPVWFVGFLMTALTYFDGHQMAIVPVGTVAERGRTVGGHDGPRDILVPESGAEAAREALAWNES